MKILKPINRSKVPPKDRGGIPKNPIYDQIIEEALKLADGKSLPIACENKSALGVLRVCLKDRIFNRKLDLRVYSRGLTMYVEKTINEP